MGFLFRYSSNGSALERIFWFHGEHLLRILPTFVWSKHLSPSLVSLHFLLPLSLFLPLFLSQPRTPPPNPHYTPPLLFRILLGAQDGLTATIRYRSGGGEHNGACHGYNQLGDVLSFVSVEQGNAENTP